MRRPQGRCRAELDRLPLRAKQGVPGQVERALHRLAVHGGQTATGLHDAPDQAHAPTTGLTLNVWALRASTIRTAPVSSPTENQPFWTQPALITVDAAVRIRRS